MREVLRAEITGPRSAASNPAQKLIPVSSPSLGGREREYVLECLDGNWISSMGEFIPRFESAFARLCGVEHGVACSNGTTALHLALETLGVGPGDEVLIPAFTLIVSANSVLWCGAKPVLVDVRPDTWCMDPARIRGSITPRTKAILCVHMYGHPCDMEAILAIAREHELLVIEDAAQAHGASIHGRPVGSWGDLACFSFYANKILTTGEGGMVVTRRREWAERAALLRNQAFEEPRFVHRHVGFNYRMTNMQAAIGVAQCEQLAVRVARKIEIARRYDELLEGERSIRRPVQLAGYRNVYWMYGVVLEESFGRSMPEVRRILADAGIETRAFFVPMNLQPVFSGKNPRWPDLRGTFPVSEDLGAKGFYLPTGFDLTPSEQMYVVEQLLSCKR